MIHRECPDVHNRHGMSVRCALLRHIYFVAATVFVCDQPNNVTRHIGSHANAGERFLSLNVLFLIRLNLVYELVGTVRGDEVGT